MNTPAVLDDYLHDLLGDGTAPTAAAVPAQTAPVAVDATPAQAPAVSAAPETPAAPAAAAPLPAAAEAPPPAAAAPLPATAPAPAAIATAPAGKDDITDDEFEALLDRLHGDAAPTAVAAAPAAVPSPPAASAPAAIAAAPAGKDDITDDEFEALLDQLHGDGAPTACVETAPAPAPSRPSAPPPAAAPVAPAATKPVAAGIVPPLPERPYLQTPIDTGERRRSTERKTRWLRLRCDQQHYGLELLKVQEVVRPAILLPLRGAPPHMLGVMNLRGQVVPVIDLGLYLGRAAAALDSGTRVVVLEEGGESLGLRVSAVEDVASLSDQQIEPPDNARVGRISNPLFLGVARLQERTVILLDASHLLK